MNTLNRIYSALFILIFCTYCGTSSLNKHVTKANDRNGLWRNINEVFNNNNNKDQDLANKLKDYFVYHQFDEWEDIKGDINNGYDDCCCKEIIFKHLKITKIGQKHDAYSKLQHDAYSKLQIALNGDEEINDDEKIKDIANYEQIPDSGQMPTTFGEIDNRLMNYFKLCGKNYLDSQGNGIFMKFVGEEEFDKNDVLDELEGEAKDCIYIGDGIFGTFPFDKEDQKKDIEKKQEIIFNVMKYGQKTGPDISPKDLNNKNIDLYPDPESDNIYDIVNDNIDNGQMPTTFGEIDNRLNKYYTSRGIDYLNEKGEGIFMYFVKQEGHKPENILDELESSENCGYTEFILKTFPFDEEDKSKGPDEIKEIIFNVMKYGQKTEPVKKVLERIIGFNLFEIYENQHFKIKYDNIQRFLKNSCRVLYGQSDGADNAEDCMKKLFVRYRNNQNIRYNKSSRRVGNKNTQSYKICILKMISLSKNIKIPIWRFLYNLYMEEVCKFYQDPNNAKEGFSMRDCQHGAKGDLVGKFYRYIKKNNEPLYEILDAVPNICGSHRVMRHVNFHATLFPVIYDSYYSYCNHVTCIEEKVVKPICSENKDVQIGLLFIPRCVKKGINNKGNLQSRTPFDALELKERATNPSAISYENTMSNDCLRDNNGNHMLKIDYYLKSADYTEGKDYIAIPNCYDINKIDILKHLNKLRDETSDRYIIIIDRRIISEDRNLSKYYKKLNNNLYLNYLSLKQISENKLHENVYIIKPKDYYVFGKDYQDRDYDYINNEVGIYKNLWCKVFKEEKIADYDKNMSSDLFPKFIESKKKNITLPPKMHLRSKLLNKNNLIKPPYFLFESWLYDGFQSSWVPNTYLETGEVMYPGVSECGCFKMLYNINKDPNERNLIVDRYLAFNGGLFYLDKLNYLRLIKRFFIENKEETDIINLADKIFLTEAYSPRLMKIPKTIIELISLFFDGVFFIKNVLACYADHKYEIFKKELRDLP